MNDGSRQAFLSAINAEAPMACLREAVRGVLSEGGSREAVEDVLLQLRAEFSERGEESHEDVVLEVLDFIVGWCSPHQVL